MQVAWYTIALNTVEAKLARYKELQTMHAGTYDEWRRTPENRYRDAEMYGDMALNLRQCIEELDDHIAELLAPLTCTRYVPLEKRTEVAQALRHMRAGKRTTALAYELMLAYM